MKASELPPIQCEGCPRNFLPTTARQRFHSRTCQRNAIAKRKLMRVRTQAEQTVRDVYNSYTEEIYKMKPKDAIGYRLYCREFNLFLPVSNSKRRNGEDQTTHHFSLQPIEIPISPLITEYGIYWVFRDGSARMDDPPRGIRLSWADDCSNRKRLAEHLKEYRARMAAKALRAWQAYEAKQLNEGSDPDENEGE